MPFLINQAPPQRPANVAFGCMRDLYLAFEGIFLSNGGFIESCCGQRILVFDHHFFHLAAITVTGIDRLFMRDEKDKILGMREGYGIYEIGEPRARHLASAHLTYTTPDEVWQDNPKSRAKWVYVKEFNSLPYQFSIALATERPEEGGIIVPVSSFPCKKSDVKKWRQGQRIYP